MQKAVSIEDIAGLRENLIRSLTENTKGCFWMDSITALLERRTIRAYRPDPIPAETMNQMLTCAKYAPSALGLQNRHFTVVEDQQLLKDTVEACLKNGGNFVPGHVPFYNAPSVVVVSGPKDFRMNREDAACAVMALMLAAHSLGLASCYICSILPGLNDPAILARLKLPQNYVPLGCVCLGYAAEPAPEPKPRRTDDITFIR